MAACNGSVEDAPSGAAPVAHSAQNLAQARPIGDPLAEYQWHLKNTGQSAFSMGAGLPGMDLNVDTAFGAGWTGKDVKVLVLDDGLEIAHEDLAANVAPDMLYNFDPAAPDAHDPTPVQENGHGTSVAGIIGAIADNQVGGRGVAPGVRLGGARFIGYTGSRNSWARDTFDAFGGAPFSSRADVLNGSFGRVTIYPLELVPGQSVESLAAEGLEQLRKGKGAVFVKSAGNSYASVAGSASYCAHAVAAGVTCSNANSDPLGTVPQAVIVGAINARGVRSSYSSAGSNLLVSAFGGEYGGVSGPTIVTSDLMGCVRGYAKRAVNNRPANDFDKPDSATGKAFNPTCNYTSLFNGTSSAAPMVSAVVALMLEANANLTWRDIRYILMKTARIVDADRKPGEVTLPSGEKYAPQPAWTRNAAGLWFDNFYGFGLVDSARAVALAKTYTNHLTGRMTSTGDALRYAAAQDEPGVVVPVGSASGVDTSLVYSSNNIGRIEAVQLTLSLRDASMRDLAVELISPAGTRSVLSNAYNAFWNESRDVSALTLASNAFNEESAKGVWKVRLIDTNSRKGMLPTRLASAQLRVYGR
ncbi:hypothetical protein AYM40_13795 [Paraburkholderia phytofirmans OLGA172]|uniref:P/Homo B domain-containing protein n=2 Tax=Burkholderiaceae TaxID=119060 RepID=A0A161IBF1_9BURK|nr:hypothetical protein AYM40_13795 [Paraburkholderia phytofirmans OLGA172]